MAWHQDRNAPLCPNGERSVGVVRPKGRSLRADQSCRATGSARRAREAGGAVATVVQVDRRFMDVRLVPPRGRRRPPLQAQYVLYGSGVFGLGEATSRSRRGTLEHTSF